MGLFGPTNPPEPRKNGDTNIVSYFAARGFQVVTSEVSGLIFNWKVTQYHLIDKNGIEVDTAYGLSGLQGMYQNYLQGKYGPVDLNPIVTPPI